MPSTQILPSDDDFAIGSPTMGAQVCLYLGCRVTSSAVTEWAPSGDTFRKRPLHGAYQSSDSAGIRDTNAAFHSTGTVARGPSAVLFRAPFGTDVTAGAMFEMRSLSGGPPGIADLAPRGVIVRASAGTLVNDGTFEVLYSDITCYLAACYQRASDSTLRLGIFRCNTGTLTLLTPPSISIPTAAIQWTKPMTVGLTVSGTGATVSLSATLTGFGSTAVLTLNVSDTSGSRIVSAGRCGFLMGPERTISSKAVVDLCHVFTVDESGTRKVQDEFLRLSLAGAKQTTADSVGTAGSGLVQGAFYWDAMTFDGADVEGASTFTGSKRLLHSSSAAVFNNQTTDDDVGANRHAPGRLMLSQRPADSQFSQNRTVSITLPNSGHPTASTGEVWVGLALRASQAKPRDMTAGTPPVAIGSPDTPGGTAYVFGVRAQTSTGVTWQLHRIVNNSHVPVARKVEASPFVGAFPGYGVAFTVGLDVHPRDADDPFGVVEIVCKVNGAALAFDTFLAPGGWTNPATGTFHDGSGGRIKSNFGEGMFVCNGLASSGAAVNDYDPTFDTWAQGALTNATLLDRDQASIAVAPEPAATGTSLALAPDWPFEVEHVTHEVSTPFDSGHRQSMPRFLVPGTDALIRRQRMRFKKRGVSATELATLLTHWNSHDGQELAFSFTPPGESALTCRYASDIRYSRMPGGIYEVGFDLETQV